MKKYYVVWKGRVPGVYTEYEDLIEQIEDFEGAMFKSYDSSKEAAEAFRKLTGKQDSAELGALLSGAATHSVEPKPGQPDWLTNPEIDPYGWAVDAACSGNPGVMEYQCVELLTGKTVFRVGPLDDATNNIGEFLAIVHALALMFSQNNWHTIYTDSVTGMSWVRNRKVKTKLEPTPRNQKVFNMLQRAISWLNTHQYKCRILKWDTDEWGEIPADFGRKHTSKKR